MTAVLIAFANTGDPATNDVKWPAWSAQNQQYISFGDKITLEKVNTERLEFAAKHHPAAGAWSSAGTAHGVSPATNSRWVLGLLPGFPGSNPACC